jgi:hypothetical protein
MKTNPTVCLRLRLPVACFLAALVLAALILPAPLLAVPPGGTQRLASPDAVPEGLGAADWSSIRQQVEQQRHAVVAVEGGHQARNPGQQWQTRFDGRGFLTQPDAGGWQWGLELQSYGFAGHECAVANQPRVSAAGQRVTYDWDATLQEWFINDTRGLEHGFIIKERPASATTLNSQPPVLRSFSEGGSTLKLLLAVRGDLRPEVESDGRGVRFVDAQGAVLLTYSGLKVTDADGKILPSRFTALASRPTPLVTLLVDERGARYPLTIDPIAQQAYLKASNTGGSDYFGLSVAVSGDTVVVGAGAEDSAATGVNGNQSDNSAGGSGAAYVFVRSGTTWSQQAYLKASNTGAGDFFGGSVAVSGDTIVVGAYVEASAAIGVNGNQSDNSAGASGAAYVFVRSGTTWSQQAYLKASNTEAYDNFGSRVAVSGDTVVVGAQQEASAATGVNGNQSDNSASGSGAAYVFVRNGTTWSQQAYLKASNTEAYDNFGSSVAVSGDTIVVGAEFEASAATGVNGNQSDNSASGSGAAYVFVRSGTTWSQQAYLKASNTGAYDTFGYSVAISGDTVVVGAGNEDSAATGVNGNQSDNSAGDSGAAYVFVRSGTTWSQQAYLKASNTGANDYFGYSAAVSGDTVVVGAQQEGSATTGVNGNQSDNSASNSGAAYVFVRSGATWSQQAYLKASNTGANDSFGVSVAVSGDTVVAGARFEDSNATGVSGNQSDNSASNSGAAYIFAGLPIAPTLNLAPDGSGGLFIRGAAHAGLSYQLLRAPTVTGPWSSIATNTAPPSGLVEFHDTTPLSGQAFYRTIQP